MSGKQSSAVDKALKLIEQGMTPYAAAKKVGIAFSSAYRALNRHAEIRRIYDARRAQANGS